MDFKQKIKSLMVKHEGQKITSPEDCLKIIPGIEKHKENIDDVVNDPQVDREIIDSIDQEYYSDVDFDSGLHELRKLSNFDDLEKIIAERDSLRKQLQTVCKKVYELVLQNQSAYTTELQRVMQLKESLHQASEICYQGRQNLQRSRQVFTTASLGLLANYRKRHQLLSLLEQLKTIKTLQRTQVRLREMLEEEDYAGAIQLCLECQKAATTYRHYICISDLSSKLQDTLVMVEEQLDVALSRTCSRFDPCHYEKVQRAYKILGKIQTAMDQLHMHYASFIHNTAFTKVLGYVMLANPTDVAGVGNRKQPYADLCKNITHDMFIPCLSDLCKALWEGMKSYHLTMSWHEKQESVHDGSENEDSSGHRYIQQKLQHWVERIWQDVQQKVKAYILATDLSTFKFDDFLTILDLVHRLIEIGEDFCGSKSEHLQDSLKMQCLNYFHNYHRARLEELRMFLEFESWELCPVKANFTLTQLREFRFMHQHHNPSSLHGAATNNENTLRLEDTEAVNHSVINSQQNKGQHRYLYRFLEGGNPFSITKSNDDAEDVLTEDGDSVTGDTDSDSEIPEELKMDYVDEQTGEQPAKGSSFQRLLSRTRFSQKSLPIVSNTVLNVLRVFGKYMHMMKFLRPIAFDVVICMSQLFDYYLYSVFRLFMNENVENGEHGLSSRLTLTLQRIQDTLILSDSPDTVMSDAHNVGKITEAKISLAIDLSNPDTLFGLHHRVVAVESLVFLVEQFEFLRPHLEQILPGSRKAFLQQFYSQTLSCGLELRHPIYGFASSSIVDNNDILSRMSSVRWDVKEIMSQHNAYVDQIVKDCERFARCLNDIRHRVPLHKEVYDAVWYQAFSVTSQMFAEGFACAKKCSNEGRALMQLDFQQFATKLEKISGIRPLPRREYVDAYIKAYYLPEDQLESWLKEHREYPSRHLIALIYCIEHLSKKTRQRIIAAIEDADKTRR